jgi:hypothetical protein
MGDFMNIKEELLQLKKNLLGKKRAVLINKEFYNLRNYEAITGFIQELKHWDFNQVVTENLVMATLTELINLVYYPASPIPNKYINQLGDSKVSFIINKDIYTTRCQSVIPLITSLGLIGYNSRAIEQGFATIIKAETNQIYMESKKVSK